MTALDPFRQLPVMSKLPLSFSILPAIAALLGGCATATIVGTAGVAGTGTAAVDHRTLGTMVEDEAIEWKVREAVGQEGFKGDDYNVKVTSFNRIVLLTGEVPDEETKQRAATRASQVAQVRGVHNELVVAAPSSLSSRAADTLVTGRVKLALLTADGLAPPTNLNVKVVTESRVVFLMGLVTREESEAITAAVRAVPGVRQIVRLFEYVKAPDPADPQ